LFSTPFSGKGIPAVAKKRVPYRAVTFRVPQDTYDLVAEAADLQGVDVSAVLNRILADAVPELRDWVARHKGEGDDRDEFAAFRAAVVMALGDADRMPVGRALLRAVAVPAGEGRDARVAAIVREEAGRSSLSEAEVLRWVRVGLAIRDEAALEREALDQIFKGGEEPDDGKEAETEAEAEAAGEG
jgi:hypothetical protein